LVSASLLSILCRPQLGDATFCTSVLSVFFRIGQGGRGSFGAGAGSAGVVGSEGSVFSGSLGVSAGGASGVSVRALTKCLGLGRDLLMIWLASPTLTSGMMRMLSSSAAVSAGD
jgi:hypothetical protein